MVSEVDDFGLGRLRRVANVRDIWSHEATAFTPWLAKHLDILGDELGTHLAVVATEVPIGEFRLDIQVVYASGVDASTVIWVATRMRADHRRSGVAQQRFSAARHRTRPQRFSRRRHWRLR